MRIEGDCVKEFKRDLAYHFSEEMNHPFARPKWVYISLSHKCTYSCKMCGVVNILKGYELPGETVVRALEEIASWDWDSTVVLTGGEPFLRRDIFDIVGRAVSAGVRVEAVSNGSLIDEAMAERIVSSGLENIAVSLDGALPETHDYFRGKGAFDAALSAVRNLAAAKKRFGRGPQISVWSTIMKENIPELSRIPALVVSEGAECFVMHPVIVAQDDMQNTSGSAPFWPGEKEIGILREQISLITAPGGGCGVAAFLHDPALWADYFSGRLERRQWKCNPFVFINIGPDGEIRSCGESFGNIKDAGITAALFTREASEAREKMKKCRKPCLQTCWAHPDADTISGLTEKMIASSRNIPGRAVLLRECLAELKEYKTILAGKPAYAKGEKCSD